MSNFETFQKQNAAAALTALPSGILQRKCESCGTHTIAGAKCDECANGKDVQQQKLSNNSKKSEASLRVPRFNYDFSNVGMSHNRNDFLQSSIQTFKKFEDSAKSEGDKQQEDVTMTETIPELIPKDREESVVPSYLPPLTAGKHSIRTVLRAVHSPHISVETHPVITPPVQTKMQTVAPVGAPTLGNAKSDCLPSWRGTVLSWNVVPADAADWRVNVQSLTLAGQVNVRPWASDPTHMVVPNTPNPVDGGNINNTLGSSNHYQAAIDDMADYHAPNGGAGPNWHSTAASSAHEFAHWNTDWIADSIGSAAGGDWPATNTALDALRTPKSSSATDAAARTALTPSVDAIWSSFVSKASARWNAIPDTAGVAGSTGYIAGQAVLNPLITAVRAYATAKGWTGTPAPMPAPSAPTRPTPAP